MKLNLIVLLKLLGVTIDNKKLVLYLYLYFFIISLGISKLQKMLHTILTNFCVLNFNMSIYYPITGISDIIWDVWHFSK